MAYVQPSNRALGELITTARWNQDVVANIQYLKTPPITRIHTQTIDTTSTTFVPVFSAQNIITQTGGRILVLVSGTVKHLETGSSYFVITLAIDGDANLVFGTSSGFVAGYLANDVDQVPFAFAYITDTLSPAFHTVRVFARKTTGGGTQGAIRASVSAFYLMEV